MRVIEVTGAVVFLLCDAASYFTDAEPAMTGGPRARR
jgi:hypothetical protein